MSSRISELPMYKFPILGIVIDKQDNGDHIILWVNHRCGAVIWCDDPTKMSLGGSVSGWDSSGYEVFQGTIQLKNS